MKNSNLKRLMQVAFLAVLLVAVSSAASENLTVHFIDVGQGDSELIQFNGKNMLIDAGDLEAGPRVTSYLRSHGVTSLDLVVATHPHSDHIGGLLTVLNDFPVGQVLDSGQVHTTQTYENFLTLVDQKNIPFAVAKRGQTIDLDPAIKIEVLSPPEPLFAVDDLNQNSIVLKVSCNKVSFLFMGDANCEAEENIIAAGYDLKSTVLKVGHHGSASSTCTSFLDKVRPDVAVIEVGAENGYGHPSEKTLSALKDIGSKVYRTDLDGNVVVTTDCQTYSISTSKQSWTTSATAPKSTASAVSWPASPVATASTDSQETFVGSVKSNKYHYPSCQWAKKISPQNEIWFTSSADARAQGYVPCGVCHPT